ncbi:MAG: oligosaccharide flippase family protein [Candidatus Rokubacteria bacterium]|nr:oligosaccharide flippase family protein [Candidatus Rokubacteria bacterium]
MPSRFLAGGRTLVGSYLTEAGRRALGNLLGLTGWTALWQLSTLGVLLVLTRALGVEAFGTLIFALTTQTYLTLFGSLGCTAVVIREGVQRPDDIDAIATSFLILTAASSLLVCASSLAIVRLLPMSDGERWLLALVVMGSVPASMNAQPLFDIHHWASLPEVSQG